jgi:ribonuclease HI
LQEQGTRDSRKVGREEEGLNSNHPELVDLRECLEEHEDHVDLLYLTDNEASLQVIHKWIGCGAKMSLFKSPDTDILKVIIFKLQKRVEAGAVTLLIKVKAHRGDPLNEEADIRAELGRRKEYKETIWDDLSDRTVYQWSAKQGTTKVLRTSVWTDTVHNYIRRKAGNIEVFKTLEGDSLKWCKEHVPRDDNDWSEEGQMLLDDPELWLDLLTFLWECHVSRKRDRTTEDGTFLLHKKGTIT